MLRKRIDPASRIAELESQVGQLKTKLVQKSVLLALTAKDTMFNLPDIASARVENIIDFMSSNLLVGKSLVYS